MEQFKRDKTQKSNKLHLDKYYTSDETAQYCIDKTKEILKGQKITEVIEPSAGSGSFSSKINNCISYDIEPENDSITKQDFLQLKTSYKEGRLFIGNPPFGARNTLAVSFYKKCVELGDYIAFILPISQLNNIQQMYEFDLIHSENLGKLKYTNREVHCCFNIYKRNSNGLNKKPKNELSDVKITEVRLGNKEVKDFDLRICAWGASIGKKIEDGNSFAKEFYIKVVKEEFRGKIISALEKVIWTDEYIMTSTPNLLQWQVVDYLKRNFAEIN